MKKTNKGFSMVELIIVIAIMAILAGALAPALIKYINKSRISTDIQTGQTIATAITTALSNESAFDAAPSGTTAWSMHELVDGDLSGDSFKTEFASALGVSKAPTGKAKKDMQSGTMDQKFYIDLDAASNTIKVYVGAQDADNEVYPNTGANLK